MYYDDVLGFIFFSYIMGYYTLYIEQKFPINQYKSYILVVFHQTHLVYIFPSHGLYISNMVSKPLPSLL